MPLEKINNCPLHKQTRVYDIFGKRIPCKCGYHKSAEQTALGVQAGPLSSTGSIPALQSSAVFRPAPHSSAVSRPVPHSSAVSRPVPHSSAVSRPAPQSSAGMQAGPLSSAGMQVGPLSSAGSKPAQQSGARMQAGPFSSAVSRPAPHSSTGMQAGPLSSAGSIPAPHSSTGMQAGPLSSAGSRPAPHSSTGMQAGPLSSAGSIPAPQSSSSIKCALCSKDVDVEGFTEHLSDYHVQECCDQCGAKVWGAVGLLHHIDNHHRLTNLSDQDRPSVGPPAVSPTTSTAQSPAYIEEQQGAPQTTLHTPSLRPPEMYMLEGASRWNINRAHQAVDMSGTSHTKIYDVRLMSHMNVLSNRVLGCTLLPEFMPPGKPTDELWSTCWRSLTEETCFLHWSTVKSLRQRHSPDIEDISCAGPSTSAPSPSKYSLKCKKNVLPGPWRASRKRSGSAPGQQAAERLFMTYGQAAQRPDINRISECVALKLLKEFREARNRPKDNKGKIFPIPQAIVMTYSHIKQLLEDCREVLDKTNLVLVTINKTTDTDSASSGEDGPPNVPPPPPPLLPPVAPPSPPPPPLPSPEHHPAPREEHEEDYFADDEEEQEQG
ncbi:hypothetical protein G5714_004645 [Onychostoma macrolepis]|uniref:Uncharacterized protein n=1 Tax=Onychostoma macrolepis TaxID=369639 RepID=A0A7J6D5D7_9TELE|nr:hypothetical protein G5714_004645 [Onychostoma macrolepis]